MKRYTGRQKLILALGLPFGVTILAVNFASALARLSPMKDNIVLAGIVALLIGTGWAIWTLVRKPKV